jgi:hypothetical protein
MNPIKITTIVLIISVGLIGAYLIVKNSSHINSGETLAEKSENKLISKNPIQWLENLVSSKDVDLGAINMDNVKDQSQNISSDDLESINLTKLVAESMFKQMRNLDQSGENPFETLNPNDPKIIQEAVGNIQNLVSVLNKPINEKDIKIFQDNSLANKGKYLEATAKIILNKSKELYKNPMEILEKVIDAGDVSEANQLADAYQNVFNNFLNTEVPSDWLDFHRRHLSILKKFEMAYRAIADFQNDPVKAYLFIQALPELAKADVEIKEEFYKKSLEMEKL